MTYIYGSILESYKAREIAEDHNESFANHPHYHPQTEEEAAKEWFAAVIPDGEGEFGEMPAYHQYIDNIDEDWELYYDYGADYYFAVNDNMEE